jgi:tellurite resistance protein TehA-like permease
MAPNKIIHARSDHGIKKMDTLEKRWPFIATIFLIAVLISLFLWPTITQPILWILIIIGTGMAIIFAVRRRIQAYRQKRMDRTTLLRSISLDIVGILIAIIAAVLIAGKAGQYLGQAAGMAAESARSGTGSVVGILVGLLTGVLVGLGVAVLVHRIFDFLARLGSSRQGIQ